MQVGKCWTWELHAVPLHTVNKDPQLSCWCLALLNRRLMPTRHWLWFSSSLSLVFLGKHITFLLFSLSMTWRAWLQPHHCWAACSPGETGGEHEGVVGGSLGFVLRVSFSVCGLGCHPGIHLQPHQLSSNTLAQGGLISSH